MKILLTLLLPALFAGSAVAAPMVANEQLSTSTAFLSGQALGENAPVENPGLLEESEDEKGLSTKERIQNCEVLKTGIYSAIMEAQANLDTLLNVDVTSFTEEELLAHNAEIAELEATLIQLNEQLEFVENKLQLMEGKLVREQFKSMDMTKMTKRERLLIAMEEKLKENALMFRATGEVVPNGDFYRLKARIKALDLQITAIESQLAALYEIDVTNFTEEELSTYNAEVAELEARILELNEQLLAVNENYSHPEQTQNAEETKVQNRVNENANERKNQEANNRLQEKFGVFVEEE